MEELVRINVLYLENLFNQYLHYRRHKGGQHREYICKIKKKLQQQVEMVYSLISDQVTVPPSFIAGEKYFNERAIKNDYDGDWKLLRQLKSFETLREKILKELVPQPPSNLFRRDHSKYSSSILKRYENSFDSLKSDNDLLSDDEEVKLPRRLANAIIERDDEYFNDDKWDLEHAAIIVNSLGQLQQVLNKSEESKEDLSSDSSVSSDDNITNKYEEDRIKVWKDSLNFKMVYGKEVIFYKL